MTEDCNDLKAIVEKVFDVDIRNKKRERNIVEARMIFSKILHEKGLPLVFLGRYINKSHATIIHYVKTADKLFSVYPDFAKKYNTCNDYFSNGGLPTYYMSPRGMRNTISVLRKRITELQEENNTTIRISKRYSRLMDILELLDKKVKVGDEEKVRLMINKMLNGL